MLVHGVWLYDLVEQVLTLGRARGWARRCIDLLELRGGERVLDVGCGTGLLTIEAACRLTGGSEAVGVDASLRILDIARRKRSGLRCRYIAGVAEALPFEDAGFDAACSSLFFHHVDRDLKTRALREILRVLRPGGRLVVFDMGPPYHWLGRLMSYGAWRVLRQPEIKENTDGILPILMAEVGFGEIEDGFRVAGYLRAYRATKEHA